MSPLDRIRDTAWSLGCVVQERAGETLQRRIDVLAPRGRTFEGGQTHITFQWGTADDLERRIDEIVAAIEREARFAEEAYR